ncbi:MAG: SIMPL domain-containing protein [Candidatus Abyssobacteria bacterium SURF_17]|uniref:SIMPL domain-containing protein n=1 Tax=Candidatus Abyssobacteria bacterium SURF_17 TaxID=2093361 RepID=A0A419EW15_9BACT|nr:MAG: SIMPL domain-containing protein [Candidatus Abyssubacteria bacterium SURF_17]
MKNNSFAASAVLGLSIGLGIVIAGFFLASALYKVRAAERYVTVKGFSERDVDADLAIWPVTFKETDNDLLKLQRKIDTNRKEIREFLLKEGFSEEDISESPVSITDFQTQAYIQDREKLPYRYLAQATLMLRSSNVPLVKQVMEKSGELVSKGIVLVTEEYGQRAEFIFTGLSAIKPEMVALATKDARRAAEQFAKDSGSKVGAIRKAHQGLFSIEDRDRYSPDRKQVRVVTTVEYFLEK